MSEIGKSYSFGTVVFHRAGENMFSGWDDFIFVRKRARGGGVSVKAYKIAENYDDPPKSVWTPIHSELNLKGCESIVQALLLCEELLSVDLDWDDVLIAFEKIDHDYAKQLEVYLDKMELR